MRTLAGIVFYLDLATVAAWLLVAGPYRDRRYKGRLITKPLARRLRLPPAGFRLLLTSLTILTELASLPGAALYINHVGWLPGLISFTGIGAPCIDDLLTGHDWHLKRRLQTLRNHITWKTTKPAPRRPATATYTRTHPNTPEPQAPCSRLGASA